MLLSLTTVFLFAGLGLATSTQPPAAAPTPDAQTAQQFTLVAKVLAGNLSSGPADVNNWVVSGLRLGPQGFASILVEAGPLDEVAGRLYQNGTTFDTSCGLGDDTVIAAGALPFAWQIFPQSGDGPSNQMLFGEGTPDTGIVRDQSGDGPNNEMLFGQGTPGTGIMRDTSSGTPYFVGNSQPDGHFSVCPFTYRSDTVMPGLDWRAAGAPRSDGCVDVVLIPHCAGNLDNTTMHTQNLIPVPCLLDAVSAPAPLMENPVGDGQVVVPLRVQTA